MSTDIYAISYICRRSSQSLICARHRVTQRYGNAAALWLASHQAGTYVHPSMAGELPLWSCQKTRKTPPKMGSLLGRKNLWKGLALAAEMGSAHAHPGLVKSSIRELASRPRDAAVLPESWGVEGFLSPGVEPPMPILPPLPLLAKPAGRARNRSPAGGRRLWLLCRAARLRGEEKGGSGGNDAAVPHRFYHVPLLTPSYDIISLCLVRSLPFSQGQAMSSRRTAEDQACVG
ncbi:uncharacterized protein LOC115599353 [Calypte anna]|uniref:uncharacterized protein LOC115599353 n=1 Tax=Calypte anna TaxID=9244 RepID=UPI0011C3A355|nr:uncharacterized protein LOC115599353 [Calypte anna]